MKLCKECKAARKREDQKDRRYWALYKKLSDHYNGDVEPYYAEYQKKIKPFVEKYQAALKLLDKARKEGKL